MTKEKSRKAVSPKSEAARSEEKPAPIAAEQATKGAKGKPAKPDKPPKKVKVKVIRDSFTMPEYDHDKLSKLKKKCLAEGVQIKKSELLRAGLAALEMMPLKRLLMVVGTVETIKTGRPGKV